MEANTDGTEGRLLYPTQEGHDVVKAGLPLYHADRIVKETGKPFGDGAHIIYVNGEFNDLTHPVGRLVHDFSCKNPDDMIYKFFADSTKRYKESERDIAKISRMSKLTEDEARRAIGPQKLALLI